MSISLKLCFGIWFSLKVMHAFFTFYSVWIESGRVKPLSGYFFFLLSLSYCGNFLLLTVLETLLVRKSPQSERNAHLRKLSPEHMSPFEDFPSALALITSLNCRISHFFFLLVTMVTKTNRRVNSLVGIQTAIKMSPLYLKL